MRFYLRQYFDNKNEMMLNSAGKTRKMMIDNFSKNQTISCALFETFKVGNCWFPAENII